MQTSEQTSRQSPAATVIIPTYNRIAALLICLQRLELQTTRNFEVIVVDDGSTDSTRREVEIYARSAPFALRYLSQQNSGPARARNAGIAAAQAPVSILIGDDIFAEAGFVQAHLECHRTRPQMECVAVGFTRWSEAGQVVTPFMRWLDDDGAQFAYGDLNRGIEPSWRHFYTSNLSFKTEYLRRHRFDERFRRAAMEDIELGYRLACDHGLTMVYLPAAIANHLHPTTFQRACDRAVHVGAESFLFHQIRPEHRRTLPRSRAARALIRVLTEEHVVLPTLKRLGALVTGLWCPNPLLNPILSLHQKLGYDREQSRSTIS